MSVGKEFCTIVTVKNGVVPKYLLTVDRYIEFYCEIIIIIIMVIFKCYFSGEHIALS